MPYCPPTQLADLADVLADLRTWPAVVEKKRGIFYAYREPFLHFHLVAGGTRRADVKGASVWTQIELPRPVTADHRRALVRRLRRCHAEKARARRQGR